MTTSSQTQTIALQNINWGDNSGKLIKFEAIHFQLEILKCDYKVIEYSETRMLYILSSVLWQNTMQEKKKVEEYFNIHYFPFIHEVTEDVLPDIPKCICFIGTVNIFTQAATLLPKDHTQNVF